MKKQTVINQIEITQPGHIQVRMTKQVVDDDGSILTSDYHRTAIECGGDVGTNMLAVNEHLSSMGWPAVSDDEISTVSSHAKVAWTPEKIAAWNVAKEFAAAQAALAAKPAIE